MSFGESIFPVGFNQKTTKEDLIVKGKHGIPPRYLCGKTLEGSRSHITKAEDQRMAYRAAWPPMGPPVSLIAMSVSHRLLGCISVVAKVSLIQGLTLDPQCFILFIGGVEY